MNAKPIPISRQHSALFARTANRLADACLAAVRYARQYDARFLDLLVAWQQREHDRALLRGLTAHELRDLGLTRADVRVDTSKPFWRA
jgi:uncharacterized protein YjiS (DUF1127 family)